MLLVNFAFVFQFFALLVTRQFFAKRKILNLKNKNKNARFKTTFKTERC